MEKKTNNDFGMDHTSFANMPTEVHQSEYPKQVGLGYEIDDTITGIDSTVKKEQFAIKSHVSNQK